MTNHKLKSFFKYHFPLILYAATVIAISSLPRSTLAQIKFLTFDKFAHFLEYALFSILAFRSFAQIVGKSNEYKALTISWLFLICFAFFDEFLQSFIPGRESDFYDIVFDISGASLVLILLTIRYKRLNKK